MQASMFNYADLRGLVFVQPYPYSIKDLLVLSCYWKDSRTYKNLLSRYLLRTIRFHQTSTERLMAVLDWDEKWLILKLENYFFKSKKCSRLLTGTSNTINIQLMEPSLSTKDWIFIVYLFQCSGRFKGSHGKAHGFESCQCQFFRRPRASRWKRSRPRPGSGSNPGTLLNISTRLTLLKISGSGLPTRKGVGCPSVSIKPRKPRVKE